MSPLGVYRLRNKLKQNGTKGQIQQIEGGKLV